MIRISLAVLWTGLALVAAAWGQDSAPRQDNAAPPQQNAAPPPADAAAKPPETPPPAQSRRYRFSRFADGVLRLDGETGQVTFCSPGTVGWACQSVAEDRAALEAEIGRLQAENDALKKQLATLRPPPMGESPPAAKNGDLKMPTAEDIERARVFIENAWRRLVDMIVNLQKDMMRRG
jgi:hypothetical protein